MAKRPKPVGVLLMKRVSDSIPDHWRGSKIWLGFEVAWFLTGIEIVFSIGPREFRRSIREIFVGVCLTTIISMIVL